MTSLVDVLNKIISQYNRYRSPEATARLLSIENNIVKIEFRGPFCHTCGVVDWIEDLLFEAEDFGLNMKLIKILDNGLDKKVGVFSIESY
ncbi:MAG: hypothetical protein GXO10_00865 [Crenarchaeota archaeon]|nr:hypothetical protein [Thermoproteota archaeon]